MVLPPIEKTPVLVVRFAFKASSRLVDLVVERLLAGGLLCLERREHEGRTILHLTTTQQTLERTAESIHLMKVTVDTKTVEYFTTQDRKRFRKSLNEDAGESSPWSSGPHGTINPTKNKHHASSSHSMRNIDEHGIFTCNEWALLIHRILDNITVLPDKETESELSRILDQQYHADYHVRNFDDNAVGSLRELSNSFKKTLREHGEQSACLRHVLQTYELVDTVVVAHLPQIRQDILHDTWWPWYRLDPPIDAIHDYYGWEISFYFAWMGFLTKWLLFPGILGVLFFLFRWYRQDTIDEDEFTPFYGLITFLWGVLFLRFWERHEHRLAYQWGTYSLSPYERQKFFAIRPEFRGYLRRSPITGLPETYYPPMRRRLKYIVSFAVTAAMLTVAFTVMILSLNLQGYINPETDPKRWDESNPHPFHVRSLAVLADEEQIFDAKSSWRSLLPVGLHTICILTLNSIYRKIATALTSWENHETSLDHLNSLILKRFLFEAFDCYIALFYLAFYERDVDRLRMELIAVFQIDTLRRVLIECIVPIMVQRVSHHWSKDRDPGGLFRALSSIKTVTPTEHTILEDLDKDEYEQFDDYMEIVIQLGYVTLFASAYPLASLISIAANWVEIRSDCFKLTHICRRPDSLRSSGLGMWQPLMASVVWMSALTNCMIAGFTSAQLTHYLPELYIRDEDGYNIEHEDGFIVVFVIFGLERLLLVIGVLIYFIVPAVPEDVADELERRQYVRLQAEIRAEPNKKND